MDADGNIIPIVEDDQGEGFKDPIELDLEEKTGDEESIKNEINLFRFKPRTREDVDWNKNILKIVLKKLGAPPEWWRRGDRRRLAKKLGIPWAEFREICLGNDQKETEMHQTGG